MTSGAAAAMRQRACGRTCLDDRAANCSRATARSASRRRDVVEDVIAALERTDARLQHRGDGPLRLRARGGEARDRGVSRRRGARRARGCSGHHQGPAVRRGRSGPCRRAVARRLRAADDSAAVERLKAAGAVLTCKTTTCESGYKLTADSPLTGITRNPWDLSRTSGGSSGGATAAVAAGCGPLGVGTDAVGSIRVPVVVLRRVRHQADLRTRTACAGLLSAVVGIARAHRTDRTHCRRRGADAGGDRGLRCPRCRQPAAAAAKVSRPSPGSSTACASASRRTGALRPCTRRCDAPSRRRSIRWPIAARRWSAAAAGLDPEHAGTRAQADRLHRAGGRGRDRARRRCWRCPNLNSATWSRQGRSYRGTDHVEALHRRAVLRNTLLGYVRELRCRGDTDRRGDGLRGRRARRRRDRRPSGRQASRMVAVLVADQSRRTAGRERAVRIRRCRNADRPATCRADAGRAGADPRGGSFRGGTALGPAGARRSRARRIDRVTTRPRARGSPGIEASRPSASARGSRAARRARASCGRSRDRAAGPPSAAAGSLRSRRSRACPAPARCGRAPSRQCSRTRRPAGRRRCR